MRTRTLRVSRLALAAAAAVAGLFMNDNLSSIQYSGLITQANAQTRARVGRAVAPRSAVGVARRTDRRVDRRVDRRLDRRTAVVGGAALGTAAYDGSSARYDYGAYGSAAGAYDTGADAFASSGAGSDSLPGGFQAYGPGPRPGSVIVNPNTGRWCTFEQSGWHWCWTP